ncbi:MAG: trimethylamine methyltransferase family protein [Candidatus Hodarchaeota archaeon]
MKMKNIEFLSKDEIENIHSATLELLSTVGIKIDDEEVRTLFSENGAEVEHDTNFVRIPEDLIKQQLKTVPNSFKLYGRDGSFNFEVNTYSTKFATIGTPVKMYDPNHKKGIRKTTLEDNIKQIRVVDSLEHINNSHVDVWPGDIKFTTVHVHCIYQWAKNTRKPYGLGCLGKIASQDMIDMMSIIVGGDDELIKNPRLVGFMNPTSPLHLPKIMTNGFKIFNKYKQPVIIAPEALAGTSAPVTLAGLLTQTNAEILASVILSQLNNPGAPVFFATVSHVTDMRSGNDALGGVETGLITAGIAQLARFYNIPSRGPGGVTDSKCFDLQNGFERYQTLMLAAQAGINYITCAGTYEATLLEALELLVLDDELAGMVLRALEGINVNEDTIGLGVIKKIATSTKKGVTFLGEKHTREYMRKELYIPKLVNRYRRSTWRKKGSKDIIAVATEKVEEILRNFTEYELPAEIDAKLKALIKKVDERTFDFYKKAEGITADSITIDSIEFKGENS